MTSMVSSCLSEVCPCRTESPTASLSARKDMKMQYVENVAQGICLRLLLLSHNVVGLMFKDIKV